LSGEDGMAPWRVILAEDEALMAQMLLDMLAELPVEVVQARDGREALARAQEARPDLVLLDAMMPELDGFEVAAALRASPVTQDVPIIFLTSRGGLEDKVRGLELGADDYLVKPIRREELLARVRNVLRRVEGRRAAAPPESSVMRGRLEIMRLASIVQVLETDRRTGTLHLRAHGRRGDMMFVDGQVAYAVEGGREGEAAVFNLLGWEQGEFELEITSGAGPASAQVGRSNQALLAEGIRRLGEIPALRAELAGLEGPVKMLRAFRDGLLRRTLLGGFQRLVGLCDGARTLPEILEAGTLDVWAALKHLARFHALGMLEHGQAAKRAAPRLRIQVPVEFQSVQTFRPARSLDISARGVFLRTTAVFPVGEEVLLRFTLPRVSHAFKVTGRVVWSSPTDAPQGVPAGMGVQFLDLEGAEQGLIEQYVVELLLDRVLGEDKDST
jgi:uncharacterized protein (TIGR02266 family)